MFCCVRGDLCWKEEKLRLEVRKRDNPNYFIWFLRREYPYITTLRHVNNTYYNLEYKKQ